MITESGRMRWPDVAKAFCIVLIVFRHATLFSNEILRDGRVETVLFAITDVPRPLPVPLFFAVSGYLARHWLARPWSVAMFRTRVARHYWLYLLWFAITAVLLAVIPGDSLADVPSWKWLVASLFVGVSPLWYLWALAVYFVITKFMYNYPRTLLVLSGLICALAYLRLLPSYGNSSASALCLVFFAAAARYPQLVERVVNRATWVRAGVLFVPVATGLGLFSYTSAQRLPLFGPALSVVSLVFALTVIALVASKAPAWSIYVGRATLPIYVMHLIIIVFVASLLPNIPPIIQPFYLLGLTFLAILVSIGIYRALATRVPWLFDLPESFSRHRARRTNHDSGAVG